MPHPTVVFVPGLRDHVPDHWQTLLQRRLARSACVPRVGKEVLSCSAWVELLEATIAGVGGPVVLAAHSAGVMITVHWARKFRRTVQGALLATPPDFATPRPAGYPTLETLAQNGWTPVPRDPLPFPSVVAASRNDPMGGFPRVAALAADWGSRLVDAGEVGHLNAASGFGEWPEAAGLLHALGVPMDSAARAAT